MLRVYLVFLLLICSFKGQAQLIIAGQHTASDYFHDVVPDSTFMSTNFTNNNIDTLLLDLNGDNIDDFKLGVVQQVSPGATNDQCRILALNNNQIAFGYIDSCFNSNGTFQSSFSMAHAFSNNDSINENAMWVSGYLQLGYAVRIHLIFDCFNVILNPSYIGIRIPSANDTLYGWIKVTGVGYSQFTILEYACNSSAIGINEPLENVSRMVYPNPFTTELNITMPDNKSSEIILYNILSQTFLKQTFVHSVSLNTSQLPQGIYFYQVCNENRIMNGKVIKE